IPSLSNGGLGPRPRLPPRLPPVRPDPSPFCFCVCSSCSCCHVKLLPVCVDAPALAPKASCCCHVGPSVGYWNSAAAGFNSPLVAGCEPSTAGFGCLRLGLRVLCPECCCWFSDADAVPSHATPPSFVAD